VNPAWALHEGFLQLTPIAISGFASSATYASNGTRRVQALRRGAAVQLNQAGDSE
jgi:hypothetical protein